MPGIVTHNKIFQEVLRQLNHRRKKNYLQRSILALFSDPSFRRAGLFGAIGPNIFDYIPSGREKNYFGSSISFSMHNGGSYSALEFFMNTIYAQTDNNNEWTASQRAYLYGFSSHLIADAIIHPFVFYHSGFSENPGSKDRYLIREQNLLFQYNIDQYYQHYEPKTSSLSFRLNEMLPDTGRGRLARLDPPLRTLILDMLKTLFPDTYKRINLIKTKIDPDLLTMVDILPYCIKKTYRHKLSNNRGTLDDLNIYLRKKGLYSPDFLVRYPSGKKYFPDPLNHHKDRWQNPSGPPGLKYESIDNLFYESCEKIISVWENMERYIYEGFDFSAIETMKFNAYTGEKHSLYGNMKHQSPIRLRF